MPLFSILEVSKVSLHLVTKPPLFQYQISRTVY